ncbi:MAG: PepSY domain-containing protein [Hydrogenophaga sp.]|nr:PepSY domain-containing protein [Hydrogenophaga sp.]
MKHPAVAILASALLACALAAPALASDRADHDRARAALQAGEILPLATVLQRVAAEHPGQVLEVELEREGARWVYEIKLLQAGGGLLKLEVDAASARVLKARPRRPEGH